MKYFMLIVATFTALPFLTSCESTKKVDLEERLRAGGWELTGNANEGPQVPSDKGALLVLGNGHVFQRVGRPSPDARLPEAFNGRPDDFKRLLETVGITPAGSAGYMEGAVTPSTLETITAPSQPVGVILGGQDDRALISATSFLTTYPGRTLGTISTSSSGGTGCSGVLVGPRHVLTAAHCLYNSSGNWPWPLYFSPGQRGSENLNGAPRIGVARYARTFALQWDYGLLVLEDAAQTSSLGWMGMGWYAPIDEYEDKAVFNHGYPLSSQQCAASPLPDGTCGGWMYGDSCAVDHGTDVGYLMYDCDTSGGHSGSPIWRWWGNDPVVLAVHKRGNEPSSGADETSTPATLNLGARLRPEMWNDLCNWMGNFPSQFASHALCAP